MSDTTKLTEEAVMELLRACVASSAEVPVIRMYGSDYALSTAGKEKEIRNLLSQLPPIFIMGTGYGHSLIGAIFDKDGAIWTRDYAVAQHLLALGTACGMVEEAFPVSMREMLPEKVPYYRVKLH